MPSVTAFQTNFSAGEISPKLFSRVDVSKYPNACYKVENFVVQRFGGAKKRGGTEFIREVKTSAKKVRVVPFIFSVTQTYILEFGDLYVRFYTNGGIVTSGASPVEVTTPWDEDEIFDLQFAQSADVLYITHPDHAPRTLSRTSATSFVLATFAFEDGPYLELNTTSTTLTPADRGSVVPVMTSDTTPSGTVSGTAAALSTGRWNAFDGSRSAYYVANAYDGTIEYAPTSAKVADAYWIYNDTAVSDGVTQMPLSWRFQGYDGSNWVTLDTREGETGWTGGEVRFYEFANTTAYDAYRIAWDSNNGEPTPYTRFGEIGIHERAENQTAFNLTASSTTGINDDQGFLTTDVGRHIRILGSDAKWRWVKIVARTSSTVVTVQLYGHALPNLDPIVNWQMGAWSDQTGWPASIGFYSGRLGFARTAEQPQTIWLSVVDDFTNFGVSDPLQDDDAITATISSESVNEVKWIAEGTDLFIGTTAAIRTLGPTTATAAFSPTNIKQKRETNYGASTVQPARVGTTALYSGYYRKDVREIAYSFESNGYVSIDLSILSEHIPGKGVKQIAYAQSPDSVLWMVMDDGSLAGMTYERDQEVVAFHRHVIGGTSVTVESVAAVPGSSSDEVWLVVKRTVNGSAKRYIERLSDGIAEDGAKESATLLDCHLTYSGASTTSLTGLLHLEAESVYVWGTGGKQGPYTVASGAITTGTAVTEACVGLAYTATLETLSPEAAARGGTAQTRLGHISEVFLRLNRSMGGSAGPAASGGTLETLDYSKSTDATGTYGDGTDLFTGDVRVPISMDWGRQKRIKVQHSDPSPFHVLGLITEIRVSG